ncbi:MAG: DNA alkylation repair protein [Myxococcales bacterium]|nr:DNA alkylation repair protein [Myxococcales bacterium]
MSKPEEIAEFALEWVQARADAEDAAGIAAYLKIEERGDPSAPAGVRKDALKELHRLLKRGHPCSDEAEYLARVEALWRPPIRELKYAAIEYARAFESEHLSPRALPLLERMIVEAGWWDLVDGLAAWLVAPLYRRARGEVRGTLERWLRHENLWLRRSALLAHLRHREQTDAEALFSDVLALADEREFFIRKAIGWVLREYSRTAPEAVRAFLLANRDRLSPLSSREAAKHLTRKESS